MALHTLGGGRLRTLLALAACLVALPSRSAEGQAVSTPPSPQIVTTAMGEATVVPDRATISFSVETRAQTAAVAATQNARRVQAVISALRGKGVEAEQITSAGYHVGPDERYDDGQRRVIGYIARNGVTVQVTRIESIGTLIDAALGAGANLVSGLRLHSSRYEEVRRTALEQAIVRARADAEAMARAAGGSLGDPLEMSTVDAGHPRPLMEMADMRVALTGGAAETPIAVGEQKVTVSVMTRWHFLPARR